jgi:hypothetical protein
LTPLKTVYNVPVLVERCGPGALSEQEVRNLQIHPHRTTPDRSLRIGNLPAGLAGEIRLQLPPGATYLNINKVNASEPLGGTNPNRPPRLRFTSDFKTTRTVTTSPMLGLEEQVPVAGFVQIDVGPVTNKRTALPNVVRDILGNPAQWRPGPNQSRAQRGLPDTEISQTSFFSREGNTTYTPAKNGGTIVEVYDSHTGQKK